MAALIAAAAGDAATLLKLAIELNGLVGAREATIAELRAADDERRAKQAKRTRESRERNATQRDVTLQGVTERDRTLPPSPQVSSSSPTPLITPSFPPSPLPLPLPQGSEEALFVDRAPEVWPVVAQFLEGKGEPARRAWIGRFTGAMDLTPHYTAAEIRDALGELMTENPENWKPALFRRYVERIRRDASGAAERAAAPPTAHSNGGPPKSGSPFLTPEMRRWAAEHDAASGAKEKSGG